jgi:hypothetical protein
MVAIKNRELSLFSSPGTEVATNSTAAEYTLLSLFSGFLAFAGRSRMGQHQVQAFPSIVFAKRWCRTGSPGMRTVDVELPMVTVLIFP